MIVFWGYSEFPYLLGGQTQLQRPDGRWYVSSYQMWVKPKFELSDGPGLELLGQLKGLEEAYKKECEQLRASYEEERDALILSHGVSKEKLP